MQAQSTTEQSIQVLNDSITEVATKANIERKLLLQARRPKAAESIGEMMKLVWKLFRACKMLHAENAALREESMELKKVKQTIAGVTFNPVAKAHLN